MSNIKKNLPLVYYRLPNEKEVWFLQSNSVEEINSLQNIPDKPGFIFYPSASSRVVKPLFIQADSHINMGLEDVMQRSHNWELSDSSSQNISKSKNEYCENVSNAVAAINSGQFQKVVLSRIKNVNGITPNPLKVFYELCKRYSGAFISLVYIPGKICWITATPELLVSMNNNQINTVSLAGTKSVDSHEEWGEKEKVEQQIVTDYINEILKKYCHNIAVSPVQEIIAGNVKHLKTLFSATLNENFWGLVSVLHPTPAVCGLPLNTAKQFIEQTEGYDRKYYSGFLGPCNIDGQTKLFVNLRCAELFTNGINLYIGGGITKDSLSEKEWEETELKSKTLLVAFEEVRNEVQ